MSTKRAPAAEAAAGPAAAFAAANDTPRHQLKVAAASACAMFRGFEAMRKIQETAAHQALARHSAAAERLKKPCQLNELLAIEAELVRFDLEEVPRYWQHLGAAALEMQQEMLGCCLQLVDSEGLLRLAAAVEHMPAPTPGLERFFRGNARSGTS